MPQDPARPQACSQEMAHTNGHLVPASEEELPDEGMKSAWSVHTMEQETRGRSSCPGVTCWACPPGERPEHADQDRKWAWGQLLRGVGASPWG